MIALLGSVGWGLLLCGALTHGWHHQRLRELLALHLDRERVPALALTLLEAVLAIAIPLAWLSETAILPALALIAFVLAGGFMIWIGRLLFSGSTLPCACSFSAAPTSWWSFARAGCVALVGLFAFAPAPADLGTDVGTLVVGWSLAAAIFVLPEALGWPEASRALLARVDAHTVEHTTS